ncbi:MarR family winged helix-turn-helix transcriptional regulator [Streptomyces sp. JB150]|uniref:MarR family winged helix-turn-helix transcriptional regulator n=1 Tax=Streptomyces sp. JB150 TaxID=2714844 RepID=UPI00140D73A5|nr:MarR family winged helix-turn-helix transcriptional regulator [Streptomyces sp. JB150]QIJ66001.1 winged helix-turn-helix transcriptional regulator [Streptomyces sp. JB150]
MTIHTNPTSTTPGPSATPLLNSRVLALAHYAARAVLESVLVRHGLVFQESVALRVVAVAGAPVDRNALVGEVVGALKADPADAHRTVTALADKGLVAAEGAVVRMTDAGRELYAALSAETQEISARIYAGIPEEDLAVAGRVLALVTERENAELAARNG